MTVNKLLSCPFCGSDNIDYSEMNLDGVNNVVVGCKSCACNGPISDTIKGAGNLWNTRRQVTTKITQNVGKNTGTMIGLQLDSLG